MKMFELISDDNSCNCYTVANMTTHQLSALEAGWVYEEIDFMEYAVIHIKLTCKTTSDKRIDEIVTKIHPNMFSTFRSNEISPWNS